MRTYLAYIHTTLKLTMRDRVVLFFNYLLPLLFFIVFAQLFRADKGGNLSQVITMVLIMGVLGSGFFGAGLRAVQERELNILRRFKVAPITATPILVASLVTGVISYLPSLGMILLIARFYYGMPIPERWLSLVLLLSLGLMAFRSLGLMVASVVNSMQESQIIIQLMYLPMLFLSGATFPISILPEWLQVVAQFMPATYLYTGLNGILLRRETLLANAIPVFGMLVTTVAAVFLGSKLFRWEKDERVSARAKLWLVAVLMPFLLLGVWQSYSRENVVRAKSQMRDMRRNRALLIRGPRIVIGDGNVIASGAVLLRDGKIAEVYQSVPPADSIKAETMETAGATLLPGFIDSHVHLAVQGGVLDSYKDFNPTKIVQRELAAYLYSGVVAVRSMGDSASMLAEPAAKVARGEKLGAELFHSGRMFTVEGGHGTEYFENLPETARKLAERELLYLPKSAEQARQQVDELRLTGAAGVKIILDSGQSGSLFKRMDTSVFRAIVDQAKKQRLPVAVHTGDARDVADAVAAGVAVVEHGSASMAIPDTLYAEMAKIGTAYDPTLAVVEAFSQVRSGKPELLDRTLVQQVAPEGMIKATRAALQKPRQGSIQIDLKIASDNLLRAHRAGVTLVAGTDSGNFLLVHGPAIHRELQLWVAAGIPADVALRAATSNAARLLGIDKRLGFIRKGYEASLLAVDGNPLEDIAATERISVVFYKGETVGRHGLFDKD